jgi:Phosphoesterase family
MLTVIRRALAVAGLTAFACLLGAGAAFAAFASDSGFPRYDHVFVLIDENHNYNQIIGNPEAPEINALANDYGLATNYTGVADPSEPNYVAMLGGSAFGIRDDEPYFFPGHTVDEPNLMSQLEQAGLSWKGYFQGMPYAGYRGYCFPAKCNGIPDSDTQYVAKHNGIPNFANMQTPAEFAKMTPYRQLTGDLASGRVANLSYIVPDECHDMHGAPPWCLDSSSSHSVEDNWLVATGDTFVGETVNAITSSHLWKNGRNAIVVTFDEGNTAKERIVTVVITNHGPRHFTDGTPYNHYSLLASLERGFGVGCLLESCAATPMTPLFRVTGTKTTPALPAPFVPKPDGADTVSPTGTPVPGKPVSLTGSNEWQVASSPSLSTLDNNLAGVSAASPTDAWAVGDYYQLKQPNVLKNLGEHWDGSRWTAYPLPDVGPNENTLFGVSELRSGEAWAVGYYVDAEFVQRTLVERWDGTSWQVFPSPDPGAVGDILYSVSALSDTDAWAVGAQEDASGVWHPLAEHWDGSDWTVVPTPDPNGGGNLLYAVKAVSSESVYAVGQTGDAFPSRALVEVWNGTKFSMVKAPSDNEESLAPFGVTASSEMLTLVGARESEMRPITTLVAAGPPSSLALLSTPSNGPDENDLFAAATTPDGSAWAVGWYIEPIGENHETLIEHGVKGIWSLVPSPNASAEENGLAGITAIPGGGLWAVGITTNKEGNPATLVEFRP